MKTDFFDRLILFKPGTRRLAFWLIAMFPGVLSSVAQDGMARVSEVQIPFGIGTEGVTGALEAGGDGRLYRAGGRNVSGDFTREVLLVEQGPGGDWERKQGTLEHAVAWAGGTVYGGRLYLVGGIGSDGGSARVRILSWVNGRLIEEALPDLPERLIAPGVAVHRSGTRYYLTVLGGISDLTPREASAAVYELELGGPATWRRMDDLPGGGLVAPVTLETYNEIVVIGGYALSSENLIPQAATWGFARTARDGQHEPGWKRRADLPQAMAGAAVVKSGQGHLLVLGGNHAEVGLEQFLHGRFPVQGSNAILSFHSPTDTWTRVGSLPTPAAGGAAAMLGEDRLVWSGWMGDSGQNAGAMEISFPHSVKRLGWPDWLVIGVYFAITALIGFWFSRRQKDAASFALGGGKVKWWAAAISSTATGVSTISFMAIPALIACTSLVHTFPAIFIIPGAVVGAFLTMPMLRRLELTSVFEYLERRFGKGLRLFGSLNGILVQVLGRIGVVVMLPALAISSMTGINPFHSVLAMGIVTTIYSAAGGFEAVVWTDVFQGILMLVGFLAIAVLAFIEIPGGWFTVWELGKGMDKFTLAITKFDLTLPMIWFALLGFVLGLLAFASDQATAQRVLATPLRDVRKFAFMTATCGALVAFVAGLVGILLFAFYKTQPELLSPVMKNDQMIPIFLVSKVPPLLAGLLLATLFAASMSTISSSVNSCSVLVAEDFYRLFRPQAGDREIMRVMQVTTLVVGLVGTGIALWLLNAPMPTLWETFMRLMALVGGGFGGVFILGMLTRRTNQAGAFVGVGISFVVAYFLQTIQVPIHYSGLGALITLSCVLTGYAASFLLPGCPKNLQGLTLWDLKRPAIIEPPKDCLAAINDEANPA